MKSYPLLMFFLVIAITGCGTQYVYHGTITAESSDDVVRDHQVYWRETERRFWFDSSDGFVALSARCVDNTIFFDESDNGLLFLCRPEDEGVFEAIELKEPCGSITSGNKVDELSGSSLSLKIWCKHLVDDFDASGANKAYLKARDEPYVFPITRDQASSLEGGAPKLECGE